MKRSRWRELFPERIYWRGVEYFREDRVMSLERHGGTVSAVVQGSSDYEVEITFRGNLIEDWFCNCPYGEDGTPCKHLAAVFYALEQGEAGEEQPALEALVAGLTGAQAKQILLRLARQDRETAAALRSLVNDRERPLD